MVSKSCAYAVPVGITNMTLAIAIMKKQFINIIAKIQVHKFF
jgi:hypothetical protein